MPPNLRVRSFVEKIDSTLGKLFFHLRERHGELNFERKLSATLLERLIGQALPSIAKSLWTLRFHFHDGMIQNQRTGNSTTSGKDQ
jgi:hypothetical protein